MSGLHTPEAAAVSATSITAAVIAELDVAEAKAWDALARYKFQMFGYWCAIWVHLNRIGSFKRPNPWADLVNAARAAKATGSATVGKGRQSTEQNNHG